MHRQLALVMDRWKLRAPFVTARDSVDAIETLTVHLSADGQCGRGEALGVDYLGETVHTMTAQLEALRPRIEAGLETGDLAGCLRPGGARNALDCALWDLRAKQTGRRVWALLDLAVAPVTTAVTISKASPARMADEAAQLADYPVLKLKLGPDEPLAHIDAVRAARPDADLIVDANESWPLALLEGLAEPLQARQVAMLEQPLPRGHDAVLEGLDYPVPLCADESCQALSDLDVVLSRYRMVNIKLDKCGGLSEALAIVARCRAAGVELMVGNMLGSSLAMAPAFVIAQHCKYVDLDGPLLQSTDRPHPVEYRGARMQPPARQLWG